MSDSDTDYMSDKLLVASNSEDIRPGLIYNRSQKRSHEMYKQQADDQAKRPKSYQEQEQEAREKGLNTAIASDNVGFKLLQKMGYKEGNGLGEREDAIKEPINVVVKESTSGVGKEKHDEEIKEQKEQLKEEELKNKEKEFLAAIHEKNDLELLKKDFFKAQRVCEELDEREKITEPICRFFWTKKNKEKTDETDTSSSDSEEESDEEDDDDEDDEDEQDEEALITEENLLKIIDYLREVHWYCLYCAIKASDADDLLNSCPGPKRADHTDILD